jgi:hypothetical protein
VRYDNRGSTTIQSPTTFTAGFADGTYSRLTGTYTVMANLSLPLPVNTIAGTLNIGVGATGFNWLNSLKYNDGTLHLAAGVISVINPPTDGSGSMATFYNRGSIVLDAGSKLTIEGSLASAGSGTRVIRSTIAGTAATQFGRLVVGDDLDLVSADGGSSRIELVLADGFDPAAGAKFSVITSGAVPDGFDTFAAAATPSGLPLLVRRAATSITAEVGAATPPTPAILSETFEFEAQQKLALTFNTDVQAFLSRADFTLVNLSTGLPIASESMTLTTTAPTAALTFSTLLPDGNYRLTIPAGGITNAAGESLATSTAFDFFVLAGDANRDRHVDFADLVVLSQNYGLAGCTFSQGDFNYDGTVDFADLVTLSQKYNTSLATLSSLPALRATEATSATKKPKASIARDLL